MSKIILDSSTFLKGMISGSNALVNAKNRIDALNVFPVPDGDTGTNMSSTISTAIDKIDTSYLKQPISEVTKQLALNMMYEARGNSGVILSQIFKGFALGCENKEGLTLSELLDAFQSATDRAYKSVFKPVEGTILTVIKETTQGLKKTFANKEDESITLLDVFEKVVYFARKSCDETPNKLKILREVGVTDSGGEGLFIILSAFLEHLKGNPTEKSNNSEDISTFISDKEVYEGEFGYCTEVLVDLNDFKTFDKNKFSKKMEELANSLVIVTDDNLLKVHGHTTKPGDLLNYAQKFGEFIKIKSENMTLQANNSKAQIEDVKKEDNAEETECGIISCNLGSGIIQRMKDFGCDFVVESGQTQNPSAQDLINAIQNVNAKTVFILPNNSNVILVAQQAAQVITDKNIIVIPTKTQIQGLSAMINFNHDLSAKDNESFMLDAIEEISSGEITQAVRDTKINNIEISNGNYLSILDNKIVGAKKDIIDAFKLLMTKMIKKSSQLVTIYYGDEADVTLAEEMSNYIESTYDIEIEVIEGNQPNYHFLIGVE